MCVLLATSHIADCALQHLIKITSRFWPRERREHVMLLHGYDKVTLTLACVKLESCLGVPSGSHRASRRKGAL